MNNSYQYAAEDAAKVLRGGHFNSEMELECMCMHTHTWCVPVKRMSKRVALAQRFHVDATGIWVRPGRVEACFCSFR